MPPITSIDQITPELAAQIVKSYILPMFESEDKKALKNRYNKMAGIQNAATKFKGSTVNDPNSVYGELKLSDRLASELDVIKQHVWDLNEKLEVAVYEKGQL